MTTSFEQLQQIVDDKGIDAGLSYLEQATRRKREFPQLFEVLKMRVRYQLGLPILYSGTPDELNDHQQRQLEDGLLAACREVGTLLFKNGDLMQGWAYLQPVGDKALNERLIRSIEVNEDNVDAVIDIAVAQAAAPGYGFGIMLQHYGTCNGITTFDSQAANFDMQRQREMATVLLDHLYDQVVENLTEVVGESSGQLEGSLTLESIMDQNPELSEGSYVVDVTHLASVVRIARILPEHVSIQRAYELARYGSYLPSDFQYPGQVPFEDTYTDHMIYYGAILGRDVDAAVQHFRQKIQQHDPQQYGGAAIECLIELLARVDRRDEAVDVMVQQLLGQHPPMGVAPLPNDLAVTTAQRQKLMQYYQAEEDLISFGQCLFSDACNDKDES